MRNSDVFPRDMRYTPPPKPSWWRWCRPCSVGCVSYVKDEDTDPGNAIPGSEYMIKPGDHKQLGRCFLRQLAKFQPIVMALSTQTFKNTSLVMVWLAGSLLHMIPANFSKIMKAGELRFWSSKHGWTNEEMRMLLCISVLSVPGSKLIPMLLQSTLLMQHLNRSKPQGNSPRPRTSMPKVRSIFSAAQDGVMGNEIHWDTFTEQNVS